MSLRHFGDKMTIGRDRCYELFRSNGLVQRKRKRPRTTCSNHNYYIYEDLLNTVPKYRASLFGQMMVADITYVSTKSGWAYLSLLTDSATRMIVGHALYPSLATEGTILALEMALKFYKESGFALNSLIHHSDRGSQYCSNEYVQRLKDEGIRISMTQTGDPLHNALAERMNNTLKNGWLYDCDDDSFEEVKLKCSKAVEVYNNTRPHQALDMMTPVETLNKMRSMQYVY